MFNKLKQQLTGAANKKKTESPNLIEDVEIKEFELDFENLWQYSIEELCDFIKKYEKYTQKLKKKISDAVEQNSKAQSEILEKDKKKINEEKEQYHIHLENIQTILSKEMSEKEKMKTEIDNYKKEIGKLKTDNESYKKEFSKTEYGSTINISTENIAKIFKFIEPKSLKNLENKIEELFIFFNEHLKNMHSETFEKLNLIVKEISKNEEDKNNDNLDSNRSYNNDEYSEKDQYSAREGDDEYMNSARSQKNGHIENLLTEVNEELKMIKESLPIIEQTKVKIMDLTNTFSNINETLNIYKNELKDVINEENENFKKTSLKIKEENDNLIKKMEQCQFDMQKADEESRIIKDENESIKNSIGETQKKFSEEIKSLLNQLTGENKSLKEANSKIKEEYGEISKSYKKMEEDYSFETKKLSKELDDFKSARDHLEKKMKSSEDLIFSKQKEYEKLLLAEKNKLEQKIKDYNKLEETYKELKEIYSKQLEDFNRINEKFKSQEEKIIEEKKLAREQKIKLTESNTQLSEENKQLTHNLLEKEEIIKTLENKEKNLRTEIAAQLEEKTNVSKDIIIKNHEIRLNELSEKLMKMQRFNEEIKSEFDFLVQENKNNSDIISTMKEKREVALKEIRRLTSVIDSLKQNKKIDNPILESSFINFDNKYKDESFCMKTNNNNNNLNSSFISNSAALTSKTGIDTNSFNKIMIEGNFLNMLKKDLEILYRDFIPLMPFDKDKKQQIPFIKMEKKMNDCIQKTQDMIDSIEDME